MKNILLSVLILFSAYAGAQTYVVTPQDKTVSSLFKRWAEITDRKINWDVKEWDNSKLYSVDFNITDLNFLNKELSQNKDDSFRQAVNIIATRYSVLNQGLIFKVCLYAEGSVALWAHSSTNLDCHDYGNIY